MYFVCAGEARHVPDALWERLMPVSRVGLKPGNLFACDGCSMSPDRLFGVDVWPACVIHDFHYRTGALGGTWHSRRIADRLLAANIRELYDAAGKPRRGWLVAKLYYGRVRLWGASSYRFSKDERPLGMMQRLREKIGMWEPTRQAIDDLNDRLIRLLL